MTRKQLRSFLLSELRRMERVDFYTNDELNDRINIAKNKLVEDIGGVSGVAVRRTISGVGRYALPTELIGIDRVEFAGEQIGRIYTDAIEELDVDPVLLNGGFEEMGLTATDIFDSWTEISGIAVEETNTYGSSNFACKLTYSAGTEGLYQNVEVVAGAYYQLGFYTRGDGSVEGQYKIYDATNSADIVAKGATGNITTTYAQVTKKFRAPAGCTSVGIYCYAPSGSGYAIFDDVTLTILSGDWQISQNLGH